MYTIITKIGPRLSQKYARSKSEATNSRQLPKAKICQTYARSNSEETVGGMKEKEVIGKMRRGGKNS